MKYLLLIMLTFGLFWLYSCKSKQVDGSPNVSIDPAVMESKWKKVDSLESKGLISSALDIVRVIKRDALMIESSGDLIKAVLFENRYLNQLEEDSAIKAIARAEVEWAGYPEPAQSVMHSLLADWYVIYLRAHLWELQNRTAYDGPAGPDIRTWGVRHFLDKIGTHYSSSLQWDGLKDAAVADYTILLTAEKETDALRPTLYDILMHRALDFFGSTEAYLTKPAYEFVLSDPSAFLSAGLFVKQKFPTADSTSSTWKTLQLFQQLISFRLFEAAHEIALLDADLKRLRFVYDNAVIDRKDSIYLAALTRLSEEYANSSESTLVDFYRAQLLISQASQWTPGGDTTYRYHYNDAWKLCKEAIQRFPEAYGSKLCQSLLFQIEQKSISGSMESIYLPNEPMLANIQYRNIGFVHLKLVKLPEAIRRWRKDYRDGADILDDLNKLPALMVWKQNMDDGGDHQPHSTEISIAALPLGHYALLVSDQESFDGGKSTTGSMMFTVSELAFWYLKDNNGDNVAAVINRMTGEPMKGVMVEYISMVYDSRQRRQEEEKLGEGISDEQGWVKVPTFVNKSISLRLTAGKDELFIDDSYFNYRHTGTPKVKNTTLLFSDRAIYRPGQKIFFKGYALDFDEHKIPSVVINKTVDIVLYDANGQEVQKQSFQTNAYGTFFGHFDLPSGGLTGQMSLSSSYGSNRHYFRVEEYKRPKFEVTFDTIKQIVRLNEEVTVRGVAKNYAGSAVSGALVGYRVERVSYTPWWYGYSKRFWPGNTDRQVMVTGKGMTDVNGEVDIVFPALASPGGDPNMMYRFEVTMYITDITGESHEATKSIILNRQGYQVDIGLSEDININNLKSIAVAAKNSDGADVDITGEIIVSALQGPSTNKRNRFWSTPDILTIKERDYEMNYGSYWLPGREDRSSWPVIRNIGSKPTAINGNGQIDISTLVSSPGYYKLQWNWKDSAGNTMEISQYVMVLDTDNPLPGYEVSRVSFDEKSYEPGQEVVFRHLTGLNDKPSVISVVERRETAPAIVWLKSTSVQDVRIKLTEVDRGGVYVHHLVAYNNRFYNRQSLVSVPWSNKALNVSLKTWRDKMEPGDQENWTLTVEGDKKEKVVAEMLLSMYDASLDAFVPHQWSMNLYPAAMTKIAIHDASSDATTYWGLTYHWSERYYDVPVRQYRDINSYGYYPEGGYYTMYRDGRRNKNSGGEVMMQAESSMSAPTAGVNTDLSLEAESKKETINENAPPQETAPPPTLRAALDETVFFYPQVNTDEQGNLTFSFKMKEGLTKWKFQGLAHTRELAFGLTQAEVVTQKQLMVFPNPPRFFRDGDTIDFQIKIANLTEQTLSGNAQLRIVDAISNEDVSAAWGNWQQSKPFQLAPKGSTPQAWTLMVPKNWIRPVKYQVSASAGSFADGEESILPVVTNRILITETLPLPVKANETKTYVFKSMLDNQSATTKDHQFVIEMTTSPAWYAVQALPYLMEYPHECAEQVFSRLYANALASHIVNKNPSIKQVFDVWRVSGDEALESNLNKNKELKSALLEETPWVRDAIGETQQRKDVALLFETNRLKFGTLQALDQLRQTQMSSGGFPWFAGGRDNWYITQYIMEGFGHLDKLDVPLPAGTAIDIVEKGVPYLDAKMIDWYEELKRHAATGKLNMDDQQVSHLQLHYLYTRSFFPEIDHSAKMDEINNYLLSQIKKYWVKYGVYEQGLMALGCFRTWPTEVVSADILKSLRERTIYHEEMGRYWKIPSGVQWNEAPVELQSLMVELYQDLGVAQSETDELRVWLLKQKQTTQWKTTKATASAIYALLIHPDSWLQSVGMVEVSLGDKKVISKDADAQAGTGYVKKSWSGDDIEKGWSSVSVSNPNNHIAWGAAYWQYWEDLDKVKTSVENNPLKVTRSLLVVNDTDRGLVSNTAPSRALKIGDKLIVRLTVETDRAMEFVHLKDLRAAGFEPVDVLSGYRWGGALGYYQSTKDLATHFFIDYLPRGKFVIEYTVTVAQAGAYSEGLATLQCMYAPEFSGHTSGSRVMVKSNQ